ncbi:MFS transporter [Streptosporangiaceae bacterium NEAU-GS5]|nr:MFS transporter [Streptosporangiaceae bacterium NEAU-GS5]
MTTLTGSPVTRRGAVTPRPWPIVVTLAVAAATAALQNTAVLPLLPSLQRTLHVSIASASWALTASLLVTGIATPLLGRLGDMYGKRRIILGVLAVLVAGSVITALAGSLPVLLVGRVLQGASGALIPLAIGVARDVLPREKLGAGIGILSATLGIGSGGGVIIAGLAGGDYHTVFWITGGVSLVITIVAAVLVVDHAPPTPGKPDIAGAALLVVTLVALLLAITEGRTWPGTVVAALLVVAVAAAIAWVRVERRTAEPMVDLAMLTHRGTVGATVSGLLLGFSFFMVITAISSYTQAPIETGYGFGATTLRVGMYLLPSTVMMLVISLLAGALLARFSASSLVAAGAATVAGSGLWLFLSHGHESDIYAASTLLGIGLGVSYAALGTMAVEHVEPSKTAVASGVNALVRVLGGSTAGAVIAAILAAHTTGPAGLPTIRGYEWIFGLAAVGGAAAATFATIFGLVNRVSAQEGT